MRKDEGIPRALFWDTERMLELGDDKAVKWLFSTYSRAEIKEVLATSRRISRKSANYWSLVLKK
jgi:hypothetical protein